jgi:cephalosporin-C deacetylase-like acetyl esterase
MSGLTVANDSADCWAQTVEAASAAGKMIQETAVQVGTWIANGSVMAVAWLSQAALWLKDRAIDGAGAFKDAALAAFRFLCDTAAKAYEMIMPQITQFAKTVERTVTESYQFVRNYVQAHPNETMVGLAALAIGAVTALAIEHICC